MKIKSRKDFKTDEEYQKYLEYVNSIKDEEYVGDIDDDISKSNLEDINKEDNNLEKGS